MASATPIKVLRQTSIGTAINISQDSIDEVHIEDESNIAIVPDVPAEKANLLGLLKKKRTQM